MSRQVFTNTRLRAACAAVAREKLNLSTAATLDLSGLSAAVTTGRIGLPTLQQMMSAEPVRITLGGLAPAAFESARQLVSVAQSGVGREDNAASAQASLALAVTQASARIGAVSRDITASAFAEAGAELGYKVDVCRGALATGIEMRRGHEIVLMRVDNAGGVESDHAGLEDAVACGERQRELEARAARKGVIVTARDEQHHGSSGGGALIRTAAARRDPSLARAVAVGVHPVATGPRRAFAEEPGRRRTRRVGGQP
ncbi:MAG TPA: hypothetical protein VMC03_06385 [Streptosporangiaceae bacterium]|nr:hypothetical protein [Streptosporangiaceae bacterium]